MTSVETAFSLGARAIGLGLPDPSEPAAILASMNGAALRQLSQDTIGIARAISMGADRVAGAAPELSRGWSADLPRTALTRIATTAADTAGLLLAQGAALEQAAEMIDWAVQNARLDCSRAVAEINSIDRFSVAGLAGALFGAPTLGGALQVISVLRRLSESLNARIAGIDAGLAALQSAFSKDPAAGSYALRAGRTALLPPDPVMNPANLTDRENRALLADDLQSGVPSRIIFALSILRGLQQARDRGGSAELVVYDSQAYRGQGRAAIAVGDLTTATNVAVLVPGIANSPSDMSGGIDSAGDLRDEANRQDPSGRTAVVAWYGYDIPLSSISNPHASLATKIPNAVAALSAINAAKAASALAADVAKIKEMSQSSARTTLIGFSMGSTTASEAARHALPIDALVLLGSPGAGWDTRSARGYRTVSASDVYVLSYDQDPVTLAVTDDLAGQLRGSREPYGPDPAADSFGGQHIDANTNVPLVPEVGLFAPLHLLLGLAGDDPRHHSMKNYMEGKALTAEASIVVGHRNRVPTKPGRSGH